MINCKDYPKLISSMAGGRQYSNEHLKTHWRNRLEEKWFVTNN
jgi:hypothetical protein